MPPRNQKQRPPSKQPTGGHRMKQLGYKPIQVWVDSEDMAILKHAAELDQRPVTRLVLRAALRQARQIIADHANPPAR